MLARLFRRSVAPARVALLYRAIVAQARAPEFFAGLGVPDSLDGRFETLVLHAHLVLRRLGRGGQKAAAFGQALFDHLFADMDMGLREMGVGDLGVGKRVKRMAQGFYGRAAAYDQGLAAAAEEPAVLEAALARNLYGTVQPAPGQLAAMRRYLVAQDAALARQPIAALMAGEVRFLPPPAGA